MRRLLAHKAGAPADLPQWACDELVALRLENYDAKQEIIRQRIEIAKLRGDDPIAEMAAILTEE